MHKSFIVFSFLYTYTNWLCVSLSSPFACHFIMCPLFTSILPQQTYVKNTRNEIIEIQNYFIGVKCVCACVLNESQGRDKSQGAWLYTNEGITNSVLSVAFFDIWIRRGAASKCIQWQFDRTMQEIITAIIVFEWFFDCCHP